MNRIIFDCDPGIDDAVALLALLGALCGPSAYPDLRLLAVTTTFGNLGLEVTTGNALGLLALAHREDIPVFAGADRPLDHAGDALLSAPEIHGEGGLGPVVLPHSAKGPMPRPACDFIIDACRNAGPDGVTILATGPLTNLALALRKMPLIASAIREVLFMGGAVHGPGNAHGGAAEYNAHADALALQEVLASGIPCRMFGLDVTRKLALNGERITSFAARRNVAGRVIKSMLEFYSDGISRRSGGASGGALHDPCVIAGLLAPGLFKGRKAMISVDLSKGRDRGRTTADWTKADIPQANVEVLEEVDADAAFDLLSRLVGRLP